MFITGLDPTQENKSPPTAGMRQSFEEVQTPLIPRGEDKDEAVRMSMSMTGQFPRYVEGSNKRDKARLQSPFDKKTNSKPEHFRTMTSRGLTMSDFTDTKVVAANVFIGNKPLWHTSLDEKRFDNFERDPEVKSSTKVPRQPKWELFGQRKIDFRSKVYARNTYLPDQKLVMNREGVCVKNMKKLIGRGEQPINDYCLA